MPRNPPAAGCRAALRQPAWPCGTSALPSHPPGAALGDLGACRLIPSLPSPLLQPLSGITNPTQLRGIAVCRRFCPIGIGGCPAPRVPTPYPSCKKRAPRERRFGRRHIFDMSQCHSGVPFGCATGGKRAGSNCPFPPAIPSPIISRAIPSLPDPPTPKLLSAADTPAVHAPCASPAAQSPRHRGSVWG